MAQDLSRGKSACILAVVVGCFAILWPSIFHPLLKGSILPSRDDGNGNSIRIMFISSDNIICYPIQFITSLFVHQGAVMFY